MKLVEAEDTEEKKPEGKPVTSFVKQEMVKQLMDMGFG
jgi:hypothetical protein